MFTGLVEEVGRIRAVERRGMAMRLSVACQRVLDDVSVGDSIAVNGVCLTVTSFGKDFFDTDVMPESMKKTNLGRCSVGTPVNLERAVAAGQRMGGHFVQGHVDGVGWIQSRTPSENAVLFRFEVPDRLTRWMVDKGSVAVNGISLTLVEWEERAFTVSVIPHTLESTQLKDAQPGDAVNIECDMIGKYVAKLVEQSGDRGLSEEKLKRFGFAE
ncbi:riboflavin synthase [Paludifilum halophilum]|uniref:Riboflavin synthase n=1 Tax=Paludifilum halophilum TaxID=1642702 RepID=A0A235BBW6_9BACL|nr:riboflavin synthase [Paludifilum halophilum]OYD09766.1 riboflavin synthase [Paludifilum halophilum]